MKVFICAELTRTPFLSQPFKIASVVIPTLITCAFFLIPHQAATAQTVRIPDPNLRSIIKSTLDKETGANITQEDMASLEILEVFHSDISDITGLEYAINLTELHLGRNRVLDVSPLKDLTNLIHLDLHRNQIISDVSPLEDLTNLVWLSLRGNDISDVSPLKDLTNLTHLDLEFNYRNIGCVSTQKFEELNIPEP